MTGIIVHALSFFNFLFYKVFVCVCGGGGGGGIVSKRS